MPRLIKWAKKELELVNTDKDELQNTIDKDTLEVLEVLVKQGHSGSTAPYIMRRINRLWDRKPLSPLTGKPDEWEESILDPHDNTVQNNRCSSVFKNLDTGKAFYLYGKIFSKDGGKTWFTNGNSHTDVEFPFTVPDNPKHVYLDENNKPIKMKRKSESYILKNEL